MSIVDLCFSAEDYCDGMVIFLCAAIKICGFPLGDMGLCLWFLACFLLILILAVLLDAYIPLGLQALVVW
jgi:hypothetical protein